VEQAHQTPEVGIFAVFLGVPAHDTFYRQGVLDMERFGVVLFQQGQCLPAVQFHKDSSNLKYGIIVRALRRFVNTKGMDIQGKGILFSGRLR
jgi:hypothetical protein